VYKGDEGVVLWISGFEETEASMEELTSLVRFVSNFSKQGIEIINFYGGYFSLLLGYAGLSKLSSGICYSSSKSVFSQASGGGLPIRYYEPSFRVKLVRDAVFRLYFEKPKLFVCECPVCSDFVRQCFDENDSKRAQLLNQFLIENKVTSENCVIDWEQSRWHFLHSRKMEQQNLREASISQTVSAIETTYNHLHANVDPVRYDVKPFEHLRLWKDALRTLD
jgi:hypothetical protein